MAGYGELYGGSFSSGYRNVGSAPSITKGVEKMALGAATGVGALSIKGFSELPSESKKSAATGALSGAATGAAIGSVIPGIGTAMGALIGGAVGAIKGVFTGGKKAKEKYYKKLAAQVQQQREYNSTYNQYLQMIRETRIANAKSVATAATTGLEYSSAFYGGTSGIKSQSAYSVQYLAEDRRLQQLYAEYMRKAGKNASIANDIEAGWDALQSLGMTTAIGYVNYDKLYGDGGGGKIPEEGWVTNLYNTQNS